ncbi:MarR family transcriptional regulator [Bradyrhizobium sp. 31Argb]|uniref:MarR family winged helix-turn-helix transcriptional regulator n=1 Tax=Bradyrhizobium TaxID=374 RepID=UPI001FDA2F3D|nr:MULTISPECIES: MarR family transcriptional regulator [Bradyrhizobium]MDI4239416.1 MarR family transcriptional regulator [Bradyrhizobium sp. Arg237L]
MIDALANEINRECLLTRTRQISRVITSIYDQHLRPFGINAPQFSLLVVIARLGEASRAEIGRQNHQERSTLTRNLQLMLSEGWIMETAASNSRGGRAIAITKAGRKLLSEAAPAWRAAQKLGKDLLGESGVAAVKSIAKGL